MLKMIKNNLKSPYLLLSVSFFGTSENSKEDNNNSDKYGGLYISDNWKRVKLLFKKDDMGNNHPDLNYTLSMAYVGFFCGGFLGGFLESYNTILKYLENNDATVYYNLTEANRTLAKQAMLGFSKGAFRAAPMLGIFCGGYMLFASCLQAYRGKKGIIEYTFGGFSIGALLRFHFGWRGMLSGGIVGGTLGTFYGLFNWASLKLLKMDENEFRYGQLALSEYRKELQEKKLSETVASKGPENVIK